MVYCKPTNQFTLLVQTYDLDLIEWDSDAFTDTIGNKGGYAASFAHAEVPTWVKNNAGWWAEGSIDDGSFVQGTQFLIKEGIMSIPPTAQGASTGSNEIPTWVKNNAGWWAEGSIDDDSFVQVNSISMCN
jgi:hypothetical protein